MLVLNRKTDQRIIIDDRIEVVVLEVRGGQVKLGVTAPPEVPVHREEIYRALDPHAALAMAECA